MTDGILLNEMTSNHLLSEYSVIIIDEAHERKINTDLLLGLLSRIVNFRAKSSEEERKNFPHKKQFINNPLRVIIMSATLRIEDFTKNQLLFPKKVNVINVESRQFPVSIYFNKITPENYMEEALKKCKKIHKTLPAGDVLIFLTGEREIKEFCLQLEANLSKDDSDEEIEDYDNQNANKNLNTKEQIKKTNKEKRDVFDPDSEEELLCNEDEVSKEKNTIMAKESIQNIKELPSHVLIYPLFSKLSFADQEKIFKSHPENTRFYSLKNFSIFKFFFLSKFSNICL